MVSWVGLTISADCFGAHQLAENNGLQLFRQEEAIVRVETSGGRCTDVCTYVPRCGFHV